MRPLSEALKDLSRLATEHHEMIAVETYDQVTRLMSNLAGEYVSEEGPSI